MYKRFSQKSAWLYCAWLLCPLLIVFASPALAGPIEDLQPGHWLEVKNLDIDGDGDIDVFNSDLDEHDPCPARNCTYSGGLGLPAIMDVWNGAAWDSYRDRLIVQGGGHDGYGGNEIYVFDLNTLTWTRLTEPSTVMNTPGGSIFSAVLTDGKPLTRHNYNHVQYIPPPVDRYVIPGGCCGYHFSNNGASHITKDVVSYHFGAGSGAVGWESSAIPDFDPPGNSAMTGMSSAVNTVTGEMWMLPDGGGNKLTKLQVDGGANFDSGNHSWQEHATTQGVPLYLTSAIDTSRNIMVSVGAYSGVSRLLVHDLNNPNDAGVNRASSSTGDKTLQQAGAPGFVYDSAIDKFVGWDGGSQVYTLDPETWHWERVNAAAGNSVTPTQPNAQNTYGRFRYSASKNAYVLVNRTDESVYIYKLSNGPGTPGAPTVNLTVSSNNVQPGDSVTATWTTTNADSCTASGDWTGSRPTSGSETLANLQATVTLTLSCTGAGGTGSDSTVVNVTTIDPPPVGGNWDTRSTAPGVLMATRFDTEAEVTNWKAGSAEDHVSWDTAQRASGNGSLRFDILKTDGASSGNWARWLSDDQREFDEGDEFFVQYRQYVPAFLATHRFLGGGGWKQSIISRHASNMNGVNQTAPYGSNQLNEIVVQNTNHAGLVQGYNRNLNGSYPPWQVGANTACSGTDFIYQNAIDRGVQNLGSACENDRARYGGLYSYYQQQPSGYSPGAPDPIGGGFKYYPDEWVTYLINVKIGTYGQSNHHIKLYAARAGDTDYTLLIDRPDIDLGNGPKHDTLWLLPYNTSRQADSSRQDTYTLYDEVIVSTQFVPAPDATVVTDPPPTVNLSASAGSILEGGSVVLTWSSTNADSCVASGDWSGSRATSGSASVGPLTSTSQFVLTCTNASGDGIDTVTVNVSDLLPTVSLSASAGSILEGGSVVLTWSSTNADSCVASGDWSGSRATSGSVSVGPLSNTSEFVLACTNSSGNGTATVTVNVTSPQNQGYELLISSDSAHSDPSPLEGATISGPLFAYVSPDNDIAQVQFSLDGALINTESAAPFDFKGGFADGYDTTSLANGSHTIAALIVLKTGTTQQISATFNVQNAVSVTLPELILTTSIPAIPYGGVTTLQWSTVNATTCLATGSWSGSQPLAGSFAVGPLTSDSTFLLTCTGPGGETSLSVTVLVGPQQPVFAPIDGAPLWDSVIDVSNGYLDPDGDLLARSEWQVSLDNTFEGLVFERLVEERTDFVLPAGVLDPGVSYFVRTRHFNASGVPSDWSETSTITALTTYPNDSDGNGIDDTYQASANADANGNGTPDIDEGICNLIDAEGGSLIGVETNIGVSRCYRSVPASDLPASLGFNGDLPYGLFSFRVEGLVADQGNPAQALVTVWLPNGIDPDSGWVLWDKASGEAIDYSANVTIQNNRATISYVDGGVGDKDGVVNGVIVDPSGPVAVAATPPPASPPPDPDNGVQPSDGGGGGAPGPLVLLVIALYGASRYGRRNG